jgi:SEC-C motif
MQHGNDEPCSCGSGKNYEQCCLTNDRPGVSAADPSLPENETPDSAIPPAVIQAIRDEVSSWSTEQIQRAAAQVTIKHTSLLAFVSSAINAMSETARDRSLLTVITLIRMFETHYGLNCEPIAETDITQALIRNGCLIAKAVNGVLIPQEPGDVVQPHVLQFVSSTAFDFEEHEKPSERDAFAMLMVLKTTLDLLDGAFSTHHAPRTLPWAVRS